MRHTRGWFVPFRNPRGQLPSPLGYPVPTSNRQIISYSCGLRDVFGRVRPNSLIIFCLFRNLPRPRTHDSMKSWSSLQNRPCQSCAGTDWQHKLLIYPADVEHIQNVWFIKQRIGHPESPAMRHEKQQQCLRDAGGIQRSFVWKRYPVCVLEAGNRPVGDISCCPLVYRSWPIIVLRSRNSISDRLGYLRASGSGAASKSEMEDARDRGMSWVMCFNRDRGKMLALKLYP